MVFINKTEIIGIVIGHATERTTGDIFITLFLIMIFLIGLATLFRISIEWTAIIILPYALAVGAYYSEFMGALGAILFYLTFLVVRFWIFR